MRSWLSGILFHHLSRRKCYGVSRRDLAGRPSICLEGSSCYGAGPHGAGLPGQLALCSGSRQLGVPGAGAGRQGALAGPAVCAVWGESSPGHTLRGVFGAVSDDACSTPPALSRLRQQLSPVHFGCQAGSWCGLNPKRALGDFGAGCNTRWREVATVLFQIVTPLTPLRSLWLWHGSGRWDDPSPEASPPAALVEELAQ